MLTIKLIFSIFFSKTFVEIDLILSRISMFTSYSQREEDDKRVVNIDDVKGHGHYYNAHHHYVSL